MKLSDISDKLNGTIEGNAEIEIDNVAKIESAKKNEITFLANPLYEKHINSTGAGAIIVSNQFRTPKLNGKVSFVKVEEPYLAFLKLLELFNPQKELQKIGIDASAVISGSAKISNTEISIGANCFIGENVTIDDRVTLMANCVLLNDTKIGSDTIIYPNVTVYPGSKIGNNVIIHSGTVIGSDGFGQALNPDGTFQKIPQRGIVVIEDEVEIGSNCSIDRATLGETRISHGVKLDNQIQIAHNVTIGENTVIAAQVGIAGSTKIGKNCMIGGKAGLVGHIEVCDGVIITAATNISKSITAPGIYSGYRAQEQKTDLKREAMIRNLETLRTKVFELEKFIKDKK